MQSQPCRAMLKSVLIGEVDGKCHCCMSEVISRHIVIFFVISFQFAVGHTKRAKSFFSRGEWSHGMDIVCRRGRKMMASSVRKRVHHHPHAVVVSEVTRIFSSGQAGREY
ncbi:hypothetical protein FPOAC2_08254 [Fusarium poae]